MNARRVGRSVGVLVNAAWLVASTAAQTELPADASFAGHYQLAGVREVAAELMLDPDHRFEFDMAYGGADRSARGRWASTGRVVTLSADATPAAGFALNRSSNELPADYAADLDKPTLLVVEVKTPRLDLTWSNMQVVGEFSNGQSRSGTTGNNGRVGFLDRKEPEWRGTYLRKISVSYPKAKIAAATFNVESRSTRLIAIDFEPGPLAPPAFQSAVFGVRRDAPDISLVQQSPEGPGRTGWVFVRRQR